MFACVYGAATAWSSSERENVTGKSCVSLLTKPLTEQKIVLTSLGFLCRDCPTRKAILCAYWHGAGTLTVPGQL